VTRDFPMVLRTSIGDSGYEPRRPIHRLPTFSPGSVHPTGTLRCEPRYPSLPQRRRVA
jgi:hypothetical protein